ncbi:D-2-hydroxyacid dehydrogenase [Curtobacterium sp. VKM Ac-2887]|uniref:D-2-hydroxyacid dehydrogenase n=1 Tax=Curtobacterium sp. VKM Ac-2887 TaxID=2783819 RepID=UPI002B2663A0|nr:D-2-hydroxyacid dehydrogenase [Curtobacterium sp. VKM Ac-2887]
MIAAPLRPEHAALLCDLEPRIDLAYDPEALPPMRFPADFAGDPAFTRAVDVDDRWRASLRHADALYGVPDVDSALLAETVRANPTLHWVHTMAAGGGGQVRAAGLTADELRRVRFTTSAGVHGTSLAEFALLGVLAGAKGLPRLAVDQRARRWPERWVMQPVVGGTVLVLGLGGIGSEVARLCSAVGMRVVGASRSGHPVEHVDEVVAIDALASVLPGVDAVVSTLPGTVATERLLDEAFFSGLRPGATFVNVGRGTVVDESALVSALDDGRIGFAALDVVAVEPLPGSSPLWDSERVLISPHTAALTESEEERIVRLFADNARRLLDDEPLRNVVDTVEFY